MCKTGAGSGKFVNSVTIDDAPGFSFDLARRRTPLGMSRGRFEGARGAISGCAKTMLQYPVNSNISSRIELRPGRLTISIKPESNEVPKCIESTSGAQICIAYLASSNMPG